MADQFTGTVNSGTIGPAYANAVVAGYDRFLEYQLRSRPVFRQLVDKHPVDVTNPGSSVTLSIVQEFSNLATTPLTENVDVTAVAPPDLVRVTVNVNEYGNADLVTIKLKQLAFTPVDPAIANILGKNMIDTLDKLAQTQLDSATHVVGLNGGAVKSDNGSAWVLNNVVGTDTLTSTVARDAVAVLRRRNAHGKDAMDNFLAVIHPDVAIDIMGDSGWLAPHQYQDTSNIYNAEVGTYMGARYLMSPRCTTATNAGSVKVYNTYFVGSQALVEAVVAPEKVVIGPQTDKLRRFFPIGWLYHGGFAIFRQEAIQLGKSASSIAAL